MLSKKLEVELKCGVCRKFFNTPRMLDCGHSICEECGKSMLQKVTVHQPKLSYQTFNSNSSLSTFQRQKDQTSFAGSHDSEQDVASESDSGIFLSHTSHGNLCPDNTFTATMNQPGSTIRLSNKQQMQLTCPNCGYVSVLSSQYLTIDYFPLNLALESICKRYLQQTDPQCNVDKSGSYLCQLCDDSDKSSIQPATLVCEQCEVFYCQHCREKCHPMRGPFEKHNIVPATDLDSLKKLKSVKCSHHVEENLEYFCDQCNRLICCQCMSSDHRLHLISPISVHAKISKVTLSKSLQRIYEKAKLATEFIQALKSTTDQLKVKHDNFVTNVDSKINYLIEVLMSKRKMFHEQAKQELERKEKIIKDQIVEGGILLSQTTSMLNLAVELIKENNGTQFSMISDRIAHRTGRMEKKFVQEFSDLKPKCRKRFELILDTDSVMKEINNLQFKEFKCPECPKFIFERCTVWDNLINVVWHPQGSIEVEKYLLEIDDGVGGPFKTAYCGPESMCTIENLNFSSNYRIRVRAINEAGVSRKGDVIKLNTSSIAKFRLLPPFGSKKNGFTLSTDGVEIESLTSNSEEIVLLANTGFSKGLHYWEYRIDYYDGIGEPSFGVAMENCAKTKRLGSDVFSWGMYLNCKRTWFLHNSEHSDRSDISFSHGDRIGVRLDLNAQKLSYFINDQPHGPIAFSQLLMGTSRSYNQLLNNPQTSASSHSLNESSGSSSRSKMLYPAVSFSHGIKISLITGLPPPADDSGSEEDEHGGFDVENMTRSISKKMDINHLLDEGITTSDGSFREIVL